MCGMQNSSSEKKNSSRLDKINRLFAIVAQLFIITTHMLMTFSFTALLTIVLGTTNSFAMQICTHLVEACSFAINAFDLLLRFGMIALHPVARFACAFAFMLASKIVADFAVVAIHSCSQKDIHLCDNIIMIFVKTKINELFELSAGVQIDRQLVEFQILVKHHNLVVLKIIFDNFDFR